MRSNRANELESEPLPVPRGLADHYADLVDALAALKTTRRAMMVGAAGLSAGLPLIGPLVRAACSFSCDVDHDFIRVLVGGIEAWRLDRRWFDGPALLRVEHAASHLHLRLRQARFPGTDLPADLRLSVQRSGTGWHGRLVFDGLNFDASFPFHTWLLGYQRASGEVNVARFGFRGASEIGFGGVQGRASFGPDWTLDLSGLRGASMRIGHEQTALRALRIELDACRPARRNAPPAEQLTDFWPVPAEGQSIGLHGVTPHVSVESAHAAWFIRASSMKTVRVMASVREGVSHLHWPGPSKLRLRAKRVDYTLDYVHQARQARGAATLSAHGWQNAGALAVEFASDEANGRIWLVANEASPEKASDVLAMMSPRASRFVVSLPGCDAAMFELRSAATEAPPRPAEYGAGISSLAHCIIPLDDYDLVIRRASDAFAATLRFKQIDLRLTSNGWAIAERSESVKAQALIEYDFGSQHLMEQAVYISDWGCSPTSGCKVLKDMLVPETVAALAILRALCEGTLGTDNGPKDSPVTVTDLAKWKIGPEDLGPLLAKLNDEPALRDKFAAFRRSVGLRDYLGDKQNGGNSAVKTERAGASRLVFRLAPGVRIPLRLDALLSWATVAPQLPGQSTCSPGADNFYPVLPRRAMTAGALSLPGESSKQAQTPTITRPLSLAAPLTAPFEYATGIEVPARLVMSPIACDPARWIQSITQPASDARGAVPVRYELWNVRLTGTKIRAVFTPDARDVADHGSTCSALSLSGAGERNRIDVAIFRPPVPFTGEDSKREFRASTDARDRHELVALTALYGFDIQGGTSHALACGAIEKAAIAPLSNDKYVPVPINVSLLQLTSLGANFRYKGRWVPPSAPAASDGALSVLSYDHNGQIGRDTLVRVEYKGFLFPLGIPAVLVKLTERRFCFETSANGRKQSVARLVQHFHIEIRTATRLFSALDQPNENRFWGHSSIDVDDFTTPDLDKPERNGICTLGQAAFWPRNLCGELIAFPFAEKATRSAYTAPQLFVDNNVVNTRDMLATVVSEWRRLAGERLKRKLDTWPQGDEQCFARVRSGRLPYVPGLHGDNTDIETDQVLIGVQVPFDEGIEPYDPTLICVPRMSALGERLNQPPFFPVRRRCQVRLTHLSTITGNASARYLLDYDPVYGHYGFDPQHNAGKIFAVFVEPGPVLDFRGDTSRSGGFGSPSTTIVYLSAQRGLLGGPAKDLVKLATGDTPAQCPSPRKDDGKATSMRAFSKRTAPAPTPSHQSDFDPAEFFSTFIGDAKLLGIVRIVDILKVALAASGNKIPTINRESLFNLTRDALEAIIGGVQDAIGTAINLVKSKQSDAPVIVERLMPPLMRLQRDAKDLYDAIHASPPNDDKMITSLRDFTVTATALSADVSGLVQHPEVLLSPEQQAILKQLQNAWTALKDFDFERDVASWLRPMINELIAEKVDDEIAAVLDLVIGNPEYVRLVQTIRDIQASLTTLKKQMEDAAAQKALALWGAYLALLAKADEYHRQATALLTREAADAERIEQDVIKLRTTMMSFCDHVRQAGKLDGDKLTNAVGDYVTQLAQVLTAYEINRIPYLTAEEQAAARYELAAVRRFVNGFADDLTSDINTIRTQDAPPKGDKDALNAEPAASRAWPVGWDISDDTVRQALVRFSYYARFPKHLIDQITRLHTLAASLEALPGQEPGQNRCSARVEAQCKAWQALRRGLEGGYEALNLKNLADNLRTFADQLLRLSADVSLGSPLPDLASASRNAADKLTELDQALPLAPEKDPLIIDAGAFCAATVDQARAFQDRHADWLKAFGTLADTSAWAVQTVAWWNGAVGRLPAAASQRLRQLDDRLQASVRGKVRETVTRTIKPMCSEADSTGDQLLALANAPESDYINTTLKDKLKDVAKSLKDTSCTSDPVQWYTNLQQKLDALGTLLSRALSLHNPADLVDVDKLLQNIVASMGVPTRVRVTYDWNTDIHPFPEDNPLFEPIDERTLAISVVVEAGLQSKPVASMEATLSAFKVNLFGTGASNFLTITFSPLKFSVPPGGSLKCETKVDQVLPGEKLGFVNALKTLFGGDANYIVLPTGNGIRVGYQYSKEYQLLGGFQIFNLAFSIYADLPFDNSPVRFSMLLADKLKPFLISAGVYGGGGFLGIRATANTLEILEASFEYGAVTGFQAGGGLLTGTGRITAGVYLRLGGHDPVIEGFFCAVGECNIAGLISMGATLRVVLAYHFDNNEMKGEAEYEFHFSIGIAEFKYGVHFEYARAGDDSKQQRSVARTNQPLLATTGQKSGAVCVTAAALASPTPEELAFTREAWERLWIETGEPGPIHVPAHSSCTPFCKKND